MEFKMTPLLENNVREQQWPAHSPDLTAPDTLLWRFVKINVNETRLATILELKKRIDLAIKN